MSIYLAEHRIFKYNFHNNSFFVNGKPCRCERVISPDFDGNTRKVFILEDLVIKFDGQTGGQSYREYERWKDFYGFDRIYFAEVFEYGKAMNDEGEWMEYVVQKRIKNPSHLTKAKNYLWEIFSRVCENHGIYDLHDENVGSIDGVPICWDYGV